MSLLGLNPDKSNARGELVFEVIPDGGGSGGSSPDATTLVKGIVQLAGDLGGTADLPTVPGLAGKAASVHSHTQAEVTGLLAALAALAPLVHTHAEGDITGLVADLAAKAPISHTHAQAEITGLVAALALLAPLVSPALTGTPTAPTAAPGTNTTQVANTAFVQAAVAAIVNSSPAALDTLAELATALGNDANFATTIATSLGLKAPIASPTLTGVPAAPTAAPGTNTTQLATTAFVAALGALKANLASPTFTGTPAAPTATPGTNTTQLATTAFVAAIGALKANLASPTFTGTPSAPTPTAGDSTTKLATTAFVAGELAVAVPKTLVDAKGDLFAGSANDTVVRVAVGSDGQVLTADAASGGGVKWATAGGGGSGLGWLSGIGGADSVMWDHVKDYGAGISFSADGQVYWVPIPCIDATSVKELLFKVNTAGAAGSVIRGALYQSDGASRLPGTLIRDCGTAASDSTGDKGWAFASTAIPAGIIWLALASQGAPSTHPSVGGGNKDLKSVRLPAAANYLPPSGYAVSTGVTGAFPSTWSGGLSLVGSGDGPTMGLAKA